MTDCCFSDKPGRLRRIWERGVALCSSESLTRIVARLPRYFDGSHDEAEHHLKDALRRLRLELVVGVGQATATELAAGWYGGGRLSPVGRSSGGSCMGIATHGIFH